MDMPTMAELRAAADAAASGRSVDTGRFTDLLEEIAVAGDTGLTELALRLLADAGVRLWLELDLAIRWKAGSSRTGPAPSCAAFATGSRVCSSWFSPRATATVTSGRRR